MSIQPVAAIGVDPHADTLSAAAINTTGAVVWDLTVPNTPEGIDELIGRLNGHHPRWAIEGTGTFGRALCDQFLSSGATVSEVPTRLTARLRQRAGHRKTDPGDATAIARAALTDPLAQVTHHPVTEALRILVGQRETLVRAHTQSLNRLRARLRELNPTTERSIGRIRSHNTLTRLADYPTDTTNPHHQALGITIGIDATECLTRRDQIRRLEHQIAEVLPEAGHALQRIQGIGPIGAATILAHTANIARFPTEAHYATYCGTAPRDASSGRQQRHRLNRWGNRTLNRVTHTAIITQLSRKGEAHHYITRRQTQGKTRNEAIRAAKRHLTRRIYRTLKQHQLT